MKIDDQGKSKGKTEILEKISKLDFLKKSIVIIKQNRAIIFFKILNLYFEKLQNG